MQGNFVEKTTTRHRRGLSGWWYRLTAPAEPPVSASLEERETYRRAKLASVIMLIMYVLYIPFVLAASIGTNSQLLPLLGGMFIATIVATVLNRQGKVDLAGLIMVVAYSAGIMTDIATNSGGLSLQLAPLFTLLIIPELLAAALLSSGMSFVFASLYVVFGILAFMFMPRAVGLEPEDMDAIFLDTVLIPLILQGAIAGIAFLWSRNLERALRERDRAEEVAHLERDLVNQSTEMVRQKEQLESSIGLIVQTQVAVANGNLTARVPLSADNVLWSVAGALNNLIARLQRARAIEMEMEETRSSAARLAAIIRSRKHGQPAPDYSRHGTVIDTVALEIFPQQEAPTSGPLTNQSFRARHTPLPHSATPPPGQP